jgi:CRP/FNR family transcriptional regulator, cyclic AMP receptor protein
VASLGQKENLFNLDTFLATIGIGKKLRASSKQTIYAQGTASNAVFYVQKGNVKLNVLSLNGKEATVGILGAGDFFGEGCLAGQPLRMESATTITDCELLRIDKEVMMQALRQKRAFSEMFVAYLLTRNIRYEEDLIDQLLNSCEKRLARILLLLAHFGTEGATDRIIPEISQTILAEMVGTTRSRVNFFMNRFRNLGLIHYNSGGLQVSRSLLNVVLDD